MLRDQITIHRLALFTIVVAVVAACDPYGGVGIASPPQAGTDGGTDTVLDGGEEGITDAGRTFSNAKFDVPTPTSELGMTCAWLDEDNCWKQMIDRVTLCSPSTNTEGRLSADRRSCNFDDGHVIDFTSALTLNETDAGVSFQIVAYQMRSPDGVVCLETAYDWGKARFRAGTVDIYHTLAGISAQVTCPDGVRYSQSGPDACAEFGARWAVGQTPSHEVICTNDECVVRFNGAQGGRRIIARCRA